MKSSASPVHRRNSVATQARILAAARQCFSEQGYAATGIREIAAVAGVSYTLLSRYFGSKAGLLEAALHDSTRFERIVDVDRAHFGEHLARLISENMTDDVPIPLTVLLAGDPSAAAIVGKVAKANIIEPLAEWIGPPNAHERAVNITMLGIGFIIHARHMRLLGPLADLDLDHPNVRWLANAFQEILDKPRIEACA